MDPNQNAPDIQTPLTPAEPVIVPDLVAQPNQPTQFGNTEVLKADQIPDAPDQFPNVVMPVEPNIDQPQQAPVQVNQFFQSQAAQTTQPQPIPQPQPAPTQFVQQQPNPTMIPNQANNPIANPVKSKKKVYIIIASIIALVFALCAAVYFLLPVLSQMNFKLVDYTNAEGKYSLLIPESYEKDENGNSVKFSSTKSKDIYLNEISTINVDSLTIVNKDMYLEIFDSKYTEKTLASTINLSGVNAKLSDFSLVKSSKNGNDIRTMKADVLSNNKIQGKIFGQFIFTDDRMITFMIAANSEHTGLINNMNKIVDSFTIKK